MRINPITKKEIKITARGAKFFIEFFVYELILLIAFLLSLRTIMGKERIYVTDYQKLSGLFPVVAITQLFVITMIIPVMTGAAIAGEKEKQTFDIMLTTAVSPFQIIWGKMLSAVVRVMMFIIASIPLMSLSFLSGSIQWKILFLFVLMATVYSLFVAAIGIFTSSICAKTITSIIFSYGIIFFISIGSLLWNVFERASIGRSTFSGVFLLFNPIVYFDELFYVSSDKHIVSFVANGFLDDANGTKWIILSTLAIVILSILLVLLSARKINPLKRKK
ncbi:hypothetical protein SAMN05660484_00051 [Eubacterium ruminantium]|uniref:ABC-2 type transporter transmembrane domain-containing protein n=1 Tax=Eubacterium ruminantium TaxID=42322 RepID=A0A1T4KA01_9FIRM|nr:MULTISPECIES: ABC transporter permease subunit [Eubacterium]MCR5366990.1 hypothetical protein [Eubacterium sp.]SCW26733.1 hypothetical protein SAMN05660484_00051 [Eubacterium ruminantium]SDM17445.1 hypothetical protein SAMN04490370_101277 [Eubacterium ruminantium]SJZ39135.1 hypothetical protein SAMN02745110_00279 [Eubacterium ruminantium]